MNDFELPPGIEVQNISTVLESTGVENQLFTVWEKVTIHHSEDSDITYSRVNHEDFMYKITILNPKQIKDNVIIRLWLGQLKNEDDLRLDLVLK